MVGCIYVNATAGSPTRQSMGTDLPFHLYNLHMLKAWLWEEDSLLSRYQQSKVNWQHAQVRHKVLGM